MPPLIDLTGKTFGLWIVLSRHPENNKRNKPQWICKCACGTQKTISQSSDLVTGKSTNCGCRKAQLVGNRARTHGKCKTKVYIAWCGMIDRTENPKGDFFYRYGGRGIKMCDRWRNSFQAFYEDMGDPPTSKHSIDRIDNEGNYEPSNCQWQPLQKQMTNQTRTIRVIVNGEETSLRNACKIKGLNYLAVYQQIKRHGTPAQHFF
jgi:hypothetical protein